MARWISMAAALVLMAALTPATSTHAEALSTVDDFTAYVWADNPAAASYRPSPGYAYNSAGGEVRIRRAGTGVYTIILTNATAAVEERSGVVHVQPYGSDPRVACAVAGWGPPILAPAELHISVRCFTPPNEPVDARFVANFTNATLPAGSTGAARLMYLWADQARPVGTRVLSHGYQYDSQGGPLSYERLNIGVYRINRPPNPAGTTGIFPMAHVTPYGSEWVTCQIGYPDSLVVSCNRADGDPADTRFTLTYGLRVDLTGHTTGGFASGVGYEDLIRGEVIGADGYSSLRPAGGGFYGRVSGTGRYRFTMPALGTDGGHAMVTEVGEMHADRSPRGRCAVLGWFRTGPDQHVDVACTAFGPTFAPRDLHVRVSFTRYRAPV